MPYTLGQASKSTVMNKATIAHAIKKGRLTAQKNDIGEYQIDPAELHRVYPPLPASSDTKSDDINPHQPVDLLIKIAHLEARLEIINELKSQIEDVKRERDEWRTQAKMYLPAPKPKGGFLARLFGRAA
jgi:hypothetical protein